MQDSPSTSTTASRPDGPRSPSTLVGRRVPDVPVHVVEHGRARLVRSGDLFANRRVVAFALPGAFTPTCSSQHLPRYEELADAFRAAGVDTLLCIAVNDPFVMGEWGRTQGVDRVQLVADGNGDFTGAIDLAVEKRDLGFGRRSRRYSMYVDDGVVKQLFLEADGPGDPFEVSDADTMLAYLAPDAPRPHHVAMLTKPGCPHCAKAKASLRAHGVAFVEVPLEDAVRGRAVGALTGATTVPQVFVDGRLVGDSEQLEAWLNHAAPAVRS